MKFRLLTIAELKSDAQKRYQDSLQGEDVAPFRALMIALLEKTYTEAFFEGQIHGYRCACEISKLDQGQD